MIASKQVFEVKFSDTPKITRSMLSAFDDLKLDHLFLIYKAHRKLSLSENIYALPASTVFDFDFYDLG